MADFGPIGGALSFRGGGKTYEDAYGASLAMNQQNYNNILAGYQNQGINLGNVQGRIGVGYQNLESSVMGQLAGIDRSQRQDINDKYARMIGEGSQDMISKGLGNSTVMKAMERGLMYDRTKSDITLTGQTQGLNAQYMSQLGLARLGNEQQSAMNMANWQKGQLQFMENVQAAYPDPRQYMESAKYKGMAGMGAGMPGGGVPGSGGSVKSPLGGGGGWPGAAINGRSGYNVGGGVRGPGPAQVLGPNERYSTDVRGVSFNPDDYTSSSFFSTETPWGSGGIDASGLPEGYSDYYGTSREGVLAEGDNGVWDESADIGNYW